jgi:hypothetical protein
MNPTGEEFTQRLNSFLDYKLLVIGFRADSVYTYRLDRVEARSYAPIALVPTTEDAARETIGRLAHSKSQSGNVLAELEYVQFESKDVQRRRSIQEMQGIRTQLSAAVFPCDLGNVPSDTPVRDRFQKSMRQFEDQ